MKEMRCECGKFAKYTRDLKLSDAYRIEGWECEFCGTIYYDSKKSEKIFSFDKLLKKMN